VRASGAWSGWGRKGSFEVLVARLHQAQLDELRECMSTASYLAVLDAFERMQKRERARFKRWRGAA
jgi:hypothetical protein